MSLRINMKIAALTSMLVLLALTNCWAVQPYTPVHPDPVLEPWRWRSFPELKGLGLQCLAEDRNGNIWFGINHGVMRYDGINWTSYPTSLSGGPVQSLCATRDGRLYAGTALGISRF
ncbi:MAG: two-component regulator propeller domain-containing protein, partial [Candidatus Latescibacteria bacterium]|nr:two-component regulator propeller domain-containing protein [Candidatus Latescibacterota bacterium]